MNNIKKTDIDNYIRAIVRGINIRTKKETLFLISFREDINNFLSDNPNATMNDLYEQFGTSEEVIDEYLSSLDGPELHQKLSNDIVIRVIVPVIILIILATAAICIFKAVTYEPPKEPPAVEYIYHDYPYPEEGADNGQ